MGQIMSETKTFTVSELKKVGGILTGEVIERPVEWATLDKDGKEVTHKFIVGIVKLGIAATERIYASNKEQSRWAMMVHEAIRLGADFKQRISYEDACNLDQGLFAALSEAAASINPKAEDPDEGKD